MLNREEIDHYLKQLAIHRRTLAHLLGQQAQFGAGHVPAHVANGIAEARANIQRIKATLRDGGAPVVAHPDDEAPALAVPARLAALPLDTIPDPAPLPTGSRMPLSRNPLFVGRAEDLRALARVLTSGDTAAIGQVAAATGMGGIGKTQLAAEFVHRYGQFFAGGVFWLSFADAAAVPAEVAACGTMGLIDRPGFGGLPLEDQVRLVQAAWCSPLPRLLIFDNCEDEALLASWRPPHGGCRVLVTSRRAHWDAALGVQALPLDVLPRAESIALLRKLRPDLAEDDPDLYAIAAELGDLPLALHLAGSFLKQYRAEITMAEYLTELRSADLLGHESLQGIDLTFSPTNQRLHVARTFALSYERLRPDDATDVLALALLTRAACFAPGEPILRELLLATVEAPNAAARRRASSALNRLIGLGLLEGVTNAALRLHRLLAAFVRQTAMDADALAVVEQLMIDRAAELNGKGYPAPLLALQVHLRHLTDAALKRTDEMAARFCIPTQPQA